MNNKIQSTFQSIHHCSSPTISATTASVQSLAISFLQHGSSLLLYLRHLRRLLQYRAVRFGTAGRHDVEVEGAGFVGRFAWKRSSGVYESPVFTARTSNDQMAIAKVEWLILKRETYTVRSPQTKTPPNFSASISHPSLSQAILFCYVQSPQPIYLSNPPTSPNHCFNAPPNTMGNSRTSLTTR